MHEPRITIRPADPDDLDWVNRRYDDVGFQHSHLRSEIVAIAEVHGQPAGLGRIQWLDANNAELGGMYVLDAFRGRGIAGHVVTWLLQQAGQVDHVWCLPFAHLSDFYQRFGFAAPKAHHQAPAEVAKKLSWCHETYSHDVLLLVRDRA